MRSIMFQDTDYGRIRINLHYLQLPYDMMRKGCIREYATGFISDDDNIYDSVISYDKNNDKIRDNTLIYIIKDIFTSLEYLDDICYSEVLIKTHYEDNDYELHRVVLESIILVHYEDITEIRALPDYIMYYDISILRCIKEYFI